MGDRTAFLVILARLWRSQGVAGRSVVFALTCAGVALFAASCTARIEGVAAIDGGSTDRLDARFGGTDAATRDDASLNEADARADGEDALAGAEDARPAGEDALPGAEDARAAGEDALPAGGDALPAIEDARSGGEDARPGMEDARAGEDALPVRADAMPSDSGSIPDAGVTDSGALSPDARADAGSRDAAAVDATHDDGRPPAGTADRVCSIPPGAGLANVSSPRTVVGSGSPASCTADAFIAAVAAGGVITFNCGPDPVTIVLDRPAKIFNDTGPEIVIDGGGRVTLSGGGTTRILYMNTCDPAQHWTTNHCQDQDHPRLTIQNLTFVDADSRSETQYDGGGAIWVRGGRFRVVNSRFFNNECADTGPDLGGAGIRVFSQFGGQPVYVVNSTFGGGAGYGNVCSNGGAISSIGVSWTILNSVFTHNRAIGNGGNPMTPGTPGGGSGGAIYNDGNTMTLSICGSRIQSNEVNAHGSAIFFVSNNHTGNIVIDRSVITANIGGSWYPTYPQISNHADTPIQVTDSIIQ